MKNEYFYIGNVDYYSPAVILESPLRLPIAAKFLYAVMLGKMSAGLSDREGRRYIICEKNELSHELREPADSVRNYLISLEAAKLIESIDENTFYVKKLAIA